MELTANDLGPFAAGKNRADRADNRRDAPRPAAPQPNKVNAAPEPSSDINAGLTKTTATDSIDIDRERNWLDQENNVTVFINGMNRDSEIKMGLGNSLRLAVESLDLATKENKRDAKRKKTIIAALAAALILVVAVFSVMMYKTTDELRAAQDLIQHYEEMLMVKDQASSF